MELRNVFFHCIQFLFHLIKYDFALGGPNWGFHLRKAFELKAEGTFHCAGKLVLILRISLITGVYTNPPLAVVLHVQRLLAYRFLRAEVS